MPAAFGESARQAAARELREESGQEPDGPLRFIGYAGFELAPDRPRLLPPSTARSELKPGVFCARLESRSSEGRRRRS
ncbi:NUDIX domain-containing protein [Streptomyces sp. NBC_00443]|uniref:NUDIX domain-containing protein n=1 Tax=Streptomyces sp. NBC_00443 TaxID=2975743 RepID=UPI002E1FC09A